MPNLIKRIATSVSLYLTLLVVSGMANATIVSSGFGSVPGAFGVPTFSGNGIPNDTINWVVIENAQNQQVILGMSATQRFSSPVVTNDGAGTYQAQPGLGAGSATASTWNFNFFIATTAASLTDVLSGLTLSYDVDSGPGTDFGVIDLFQFATTQVIEDSQNLSFDFLYNGALPFISAPTGGFSPFESGKYAFNLQATYDSAAAGPVQNGVGITVQVVPEPGVFALFGVGLLFVASRRYRAKK